MFWISSRPLSNLADVYAACLLPYGLGYPLWFPEPHGTGEAQIGDVGYIDEEGRFMRILNTQSTITPVSFCGRPPYENPNPLPKDHHALLILPKRIGLHAQRHKSDGFEETTLNVQGNA